jgi:hypothetical protein
VETCFEFEYVLYIAQTGYKCQTKTQTKNSEVKKNKIFITKYIISIRSYGNDILHIVEKK